ncbi:MAG TPA: hypothetical protein VFA33_11825 [Bryobacteraceae bacterium]|nr:hypothetical protein [Bryobacteraceae bacterium]
MPVFWISQLLLAYSLLAAGLGCALYLFCSIKREQCTERRRSAARMDVLESALRGACSRLEELRAEVREAQPGQSAGVVLHGGLNLNRRAQVLRLYRRGEAVPTIAAALAVPQREVELLLKVQRLVLKQS